MEEGGTDGQVKYVVLVMGLVSLVEFIDKLQEFLLVLHIALICTQ
jgi:hypothetical protein